MNYWMTEERREIARQYVHDMINSFVEDPQGAGYHEEYDPLMCRSTHLTLDDFSRKHAMMTGTPNVIPSLMYCTILTMRSMISRDIVCV